MHSTGSSSNGSGLTPTSSAASRPTSAPVPASIWTTSRSRSAKHRRRRRRPGTLHGSHRDIIPVEQHHSSGKYEVSQPLSPVLAERLEQPLVRTFCDFLDSGGYSSERVRFTLDGVDYVTDIVVRSVGLLIEAKYHVVAVDPHGDRPDQGLRLHGVRGEPERLYLVAVLFGGRPTESACATLHVKVSKPAGL